jgi:hypothetical protein
VSDAEAELRAAIDRLKAKRDAEPDALRRVEIQNEIYRINQDLVTLQRKQRQREGTGL